MIKTGRTFFHSARLNDIDFIFKIPSAENCQKNGSIFLGSHDGVQHEHLSGRRITSLLTIMQGNQYRRLRMKERLEELKSQGTVSHHYHITLSQPICDFWKVSSKIIHQNLQRSNMLVHCVYGKSRSPSTVAAFLINNQGYSSKQACKLIEERRGIIFQKYWKDQLQMLESRRQKS